MRTPFRLILSLALLLCGAVPAFAAVCGTSVTWLNNTPTTTPFGANLVSALNYACMVIVDPTTSTQALAIDNAGKIGINALPALPAGSASLGTVGLNTGSNTVGKVDILGNAAATLDATVGAGTAPTNMLVAGALYNSTVPAPTNGQSAALQMDANGGMRLGTQCPNVLNIAQTATTDVHTFTHFGYICSIMLISATAQNIGIDEGTGTTCETSGTALIGVSSTASATPQMAVPANGGLSMVSGVPWLRTQASADHLCVLQSGAGEVAGTITYADLAQ